MKIMIIAPFASSAGKFICQPEKGLGGGRRRTQSSYYVCTVAQHDGLDYIMLQYTSICVYIYIYIYIHMCYAYTCVYIYIYMHTYVYIYIYIYGESERERERFNVIYIYICIERERDSCTAACTARRSSGATVALPSILYYTRMYMIHLFNIICYALII